MDDVVLKIEGMHCASCARGIDKSIRQLPGVEDVSVNFATSKALIKLKPGYEDTKALIRAVHNAGYEAEISQDTPHGQHHHPADSLAFRKFIIAAALTLPLILQMVWVPLGIAPEMPTWVQFALATIVQFWCGRSFYTASYHSAKNGTANMDLLIALGTSAAYFYSLAMIFFNIPGHLYFETSATIITLILFGRWLEDKSKGKASEAISKLLQLQPKIAHVERNGALADIPVSEIKPEDTFKVLPGENIPVDGVVLEGESSVNESLLTGESLPVSKSSGMNIFAATNNQNGVLKAKATDVGDKTVLAGIVRLVEQAQNSRAPIQRLADRISEVFVPLVILISLITFVGWWLYSGDATLALINSVAVLVIACPCALGLATPTVIVVASGKAASSGIFFKEASALEQAQNIQELILDKTGTITKGQPVVTDALAKEPDKMMTVAYALESNSKHPLAQAIIEYAKQHRLTLHQLKEFESIPGKGVRGKYNDIDYYLGSVKFAEEQGLSFDISITDKLEREGKTVSLVWNKWGVFGIIAVADPVRETSAKAIKTLKQMNIHPVMLTGDNSHTAAAIAKQVGIDEVFGEVLPAEKAAKVEEIKKRGKVVGMVGDGINDAPALAAADVGFSIGAGSDVAIEASDITLVKNDLMSVVEAIELSKATFRKIKQNLFFAFIYNILGIPLAALGMLNPVIAAAAMAMSSVSVVGNALLLRLWKPEK